MKVNNGNGNNLRKKMTYIILQVKILCLKFYRMLICFTYFIVSYLLITHLNTITFSIGFFVSLMMKQELKKISFNRTILGHGFSFNQFDWSCIFSTSKVTNKVRGTNQGRVLS